MSWKLCGHSKAKRRRLIIRCIDFALKVIITGAVILSMLWAVGHFTAQAAPVIEDALWDTYHAIMG